ncbi:MAG: hypothetical protein ACI9HB_003398, partial [Gammaproteobacteria bacterium]
LHLGSTGRVIEHFGLQLKRLAQAFRVLSIRHMTLFDQLQSWV